MQFRIAESFSKALSKLTAQEQSAVKITVFDLQQDPAAPGLKFHRIDKSKDPNFWSIRANRDVRVIVHKTNDSFLICYTDHHDDAYKWAERRRIETHPKTGAAQIVEVRERIEDIIVPRHIEVDGGAEPELPLLFTNYSDDELLGYGVPEDWLEDVKAANEESLLSLADHLPAEAAEALLELAVGKIPEVQVIAYTDIPEPFEHPDAQRRFRVMENVDELKLALEYPWDQWTVFLHPSQREVVEQVFNGPARVSGSAGTGKTVVAIHRAANILIEESDAKLLLTTFSLPLANALEKKLEILIGKDSSIAPRVSVLPFNGVARDLFTLAFGHEPRAASEAQIRSALKSAADQLGVTEFSQRFLFSEWANVVDAWKVANLDQYRDIPRLGRKNRLGAKQRERIWPIFEKTRQLLTKQGIATWPMIFAQVTEYFSQREDKPFSHIVVDEAQDLSVPELRMFSTIVPNRSNTMFFAGDLGQRIFQEPFSWKSLGIDVRGRSRTLKVNYRTSHQIREAADRLLPKQVADVDGVAQDRTGTVSIFNGPEPEIALVEDSQQEVRQVGEWVRQVTADGVEPDEIGIFVRSKAELDRARSAVNEAGLSQLELSERAEESKGRISIGTMHLAKGLEFKAVVVMACDDEVLPLSERIENVADEAELDEVYDTERHLFYVACTRARDKLLVTGVNPGSEFIEDMLLS